MVSDFLVYFDVKSFPFVKINPCEISKPLHSRKLVQTKILRRKCSEKLKKLVCNTMSFICWPNDSVKNVLLFFNSELKTLSKKGDAGNNPFKWHLIILIHLAGLHTGSIFNSTDGKIFLKGLKSLHLLLERAWLKKSS